MARAVRRRLLYGKLPRDVEDQLSTLHISKVWELLHQKFGFNVKLWKQDFRLYYQQQPHSITVEEAFVEYGEEFINPVLNAVLRRDRYHATWSNLLKYIVKKY